MKNYKLLLLVPALALVLSGCSLFGRNITFGPNDDIIDGPNDDPDDNPDNPDNIDEEQYYTVTWQNIDGQVLETDYNVRRGEMPNYDGSEPTYFVEGNTEYIFKGWSPEPSPVVADITYTAQYNQFQHSGIQDGFVWELFLTDESMLDGTKKEYYVNISGFDPNYEGKTITIPSSINEYPVKIINAYRQSGQIFSFEKIIIEPELSKCFIGNYSNIKKLCFNSAPEFLKLTGLVSLETTTYNNGVYLGNDTTDYFACIGYVSTDDTHILNLHESCEFLSISQEDYYYSWIDCQQINFGKNIKHFMVPEDSFHTLWEERSDRNLKSINVDVNNKNYCSVDGVVYSKDLTNAIYCPLHKTGIYQESYPF